MPAELVSIDDVAPVMPSRRGNQLSDELIDAVSAVDRALYEAGLIPNSYVSLGGAHKNAMEELRSREWRARFALSRFWERRARRLDRELRRALPGIGSDARGQAVEAIVGRGRGATDRDAQLLSPFEAQLVAAYRRMDQAGRLMMRTLFERLAAATSTNDEGSCEGGAQ